MSRMRGGSAPEVQTLMIAFMELRESSARGRARKVHEVTLWPLRVLKLASKERMKDLPRPREEEFGSGPDFSPIA